MKTLILLLLSCFTLQLSAQTNIISTNQKAEDIMLGNYNPADYTAQLIIEHPDTISQRINKEISSDSLKSYIIKLGSFYNRNTGSDTLSPITGVGAARNWVYSKFEEFSSKSDNRLVTSFLQFDQQICTMGRHKNIFCVLPGTDPNDHSIILVEGHMDSRCEGLCDITCQANGIEDNASGSALVMELARVMSKYTFKNTLVFVVLIGEEQSLAGSTAFATYIKNKAIKMKAVLNNDVIGGIICGKTSSPPSCPGEGDIDSTHVRIFSYGGFNSPHKQLARFSKLEYKEQLTPYLKVPMGINLQTPEDRTGRGGDHIPFRQMSYTSIRYTSANEDGDADVTDPNYKDRQHSFRDILGVDTNNDGEIDSFYVDFHYLARNCVLNGNTIAMAAQGIVTPDFDLLSSPKNMVNVQLKPSVTYPFYRIALRSQTNDWDTVYTVTNLINLVPVFKNFIAKVYVSVSSVNDLGIESLFSAEKEHSIVATNEVTAIPEFELLQNRPNPFDEATYIVFSSRKAIQEKNAYVLISDVSGLEIKRIPVNIKEGINEVLYEHGYHATGSLVYSLVVNNRVIDSKRMVFAN